MPLTADSSAFLLRIMPLTADLAAFLLLMSPLVDDSAVFFLLMTPLIGDLKSLLLIMLPLVHDSNDSFLLRTCLLADSAASLLLLLLPFAIFYPVLFRNAYKNQWIFSIICSSATPALPYAPYTKRMMHISYFCYDRHIFVITSYIAASSFRHCNVMAPSLCPPKSSILRLFQFKIALWHCNNCNWTPSNPPSDDLYRQNAAQIASRSAGSAYQPIYTATFWPKRLTRSPSKWHEMVFESVEYNLTA